MISIPVSFLLAALFFGLGLLLFSWRVLPLLSRRLFFLLFSLMALEAGLVGARFAFGTYDFLALQRALPVWIAPAVYLSFAALTIPAERMRRKIALNGLLALALTLAMLIPVSVAGYVDLLIAGSFIVYIAALLRIWGQGPDRFCEVPTSLNVLLRRLLAAAIAVMSATLVIDALIAVFFARKMDDAAAVTVSLASLFTLLVAAGLTIVSLRGKSGSRAGAGGGGQEDRANGKDLVEAARSVLKDQGFYKDPNLTLTRLARRVGVPDRELSRAVNQTLGINVSQFVNRVRLEEAARLLARTDDPVSIIQEQVGFLTRSNFYREFQKHYGEAPGTYRRKVHSPPARSSR